ncbi:MAG: cobaltochelatase subunit CobN, partial [Proteobacteria bacterium]|nr:cobaltochelatase subunit CobN [Pseudomonadota bacterium]
AYFRAGGSANLRALLRRLARHAGADLPVPPPAPLPNAGAWLPGTGPVPLRTLLAALPDSRPVVPVLFYRSMLLAEDMAPVAALADALAARGLAPAPLFVASLKEADSLALLREALPALRPDAIVTTTAFAAGEQASVLTAPGVPVLQAIMATTARTAWESSPRGLGAADLAMHVVLPELDGRVLVGALSFKSAVDSSADVTEVGDQEDDQGGTPEPFPPRHGGRRPAIHAFGSTSPSRTGEGPQAVDGGPSPAMPGETPRAATPFPGFTRTINRPEPDRITQVADRIAALVRLRRTPAAERRLAILLPDYPGAGGRTGYAVGLDGPASTLALLRDLADAGYAVADMPAEPRDLVAALDHEVPGLPLADYTAHFANLPAAAREAVTAAWGAPDTDPSVRDGAFQFRTLTTGAVTIAVAPDRGLTANRRVDWHDPVLPPRHALLAFGFWLRHRLDVHAVVHMGAHGSLEWLPGKAVALTASCFPETVLGALPVLYPFLVSNPGEAAQARRRIGAVTLGHLPPRLAGAGLHGATGDLERLLDELAAADGLDRKRRDRLMRLVLQAAQPGTIPDLPPDASPDEALRRIDSWLCDLKELAIKDGLHTYGRTDPHDDPVRAASAEAERAALLAALDGRHIPPGPGGAPNRGRPDVLPTGRNLFAIDPRGVPTATAMDLARLAAEEVLRLHLQEQGEALRSIVLDLWGSATLRTGGEEIALGLVLMGCRPVWDNGGRVTGVEVLPPAVMGRPRVDVTWRVSGLFRDLFPAQIALLDAATRAVAARDESDHDNPLAAAVKTGAAPARIFGAAPGAYGAGPEDALATGAWSAREDLGRAYLAATSHTYGGAGGDAQPAPGAFADRVAAAQAVVHIGDDPARDLLEGGADAAHIGGFAAAAEILGTAPALLTLDTTDAARPRARPLATALARLVHGRVSPRFIEGQMRHGPRGAAELAETVDRLVAFAETTNAVPGVLLDHVHDAYLGDPAVRDFLRHENPAAARAIAGRLNDALRRGCWHPRRNGTVFELQEMLTT